MRDGFEEDDDTNSPETRALAFPRRQVTALGAARAALPPKPERPAARAVVQQRGEAYRKQVRDPVNPRQRISITGDSHAEVEARAEALARTRRELKLGMLSPAQAKEETRRRVHGELTVLDIWNRYVVTLSDTWQKQARSVWVNQLSSTFGELGAWDVNETVWKEWELKMRKGAYAETTIRGAYDVLTAAFRRAFRDGMLERMPWRADGSGAIRPGKSTARARLDDIENGVEREAARSWEECLLLIRAASEIDRERVEAGRFADLAYRLTVMMLCGLRQGEACALSWDKLVIDHGIAIVRIDTQVTDQWKDKHTDWQRPQRLPKGKRKRSIALAPGAVQALKAQRENLRRHGLYEPHGPVFPRDVKEPGRARWRTHAETIKPDVIRKIVVRAGLPNLERWVTHSLRHTFSTIEVALSGGDLRTVQKRTGHADIRTLQGYMHAAKRERHVGSYTPDLPEGALRDPRELVLRAQDPNNVPRLVAASEVEDPGGELVDDSPVTMTPSVARVIDAIAEVAVREDEALAVAAKKREARKAKRNEQARARGREHRGSPLEPLVKAWIDAGMPGKRPRAVTDIAERAYETEYKRATYNGATKAEAQKKARAKKRGILGGYTKVLMRLQRGAGERAPVPTETAPIPAIGEDWVSGGNNV